MHASQRQIVFHNTGSELPHTGSTMASYCSGFFLICFAHPNAFSEDGFEASALRLTPVA